MLTPLRRRLAATAVVLLLPALGACTYQTDQVYQPAVGVNSRDAEVDVLGAVVVSDTDGEGTFSATFVNNNPDEPDTLTGITGEGVQAQLTGPVEIGPEGLLNLAETGAVSLTGENIALGRFVRLTLSFQNGGDTELNVPVVEFEEEFKNVEKARPSSPASPSATP